MDTQKLKVKDLVTIGVFAIIYFIVYYAVGMIGLVPILYLVFPAVFAVVGGVIVMLFMAKEQKPWAFFIFGTLPALIGFIAGHTILFLGLSALLALIAEFIRRQGNYKSFKYNMLAYAIYSMWPAGSLMQILLIPSIVDLLSQAMGAEYTNALFMLVTWPNMALVYASAFICGIAGAYIGKFFLKKHFEKAGIV